MEKMKKTDKVEPYSWFCITNSGTSKQGVVEERYKQYNADQRERITDRWAAHILNRTG